jgi:hypothetical protein
VRILRTSRRAAKGKSVLRALVGGPLEGGIEPAAIREPRNGPASTGRGHHPQVSHFTREHRNFLGQTRFIQTQREENVAWA